MISKEEAQKMWTDADAKAYAEAERRIDEQIRTTERPVVGLASVVGLNHRVKTRLSNDLVSAGWEIRWRDGDPNDMRDPGPYLELS